MSGCVQCGGCPLCQNHTDEDKVFCAACSIEAAEYEQLWR